MNRRLAGLLLAVVAATGLLATPAGVTEVRAATPDLTIVTNARYDVQPAQHRVHVTLDMVLANHLKDTTTRRFYFDKALLQVLPGVSGLKLTGPSGAPRATVSKAAATYTLLQLDLGQRLYSGNSASYRLVFDLVDKGGAATRDLRVGGSLISFPVWAFATDATPGSTVRVVFPAGYQVEVQTGEIPPPTTAADGTVSFQTPKLDKPLTFFAYLVADRPAAYVERTRVATVGTTPVRLSIQGWADDMAWSDRVGGLVARALPLLSKQIGLPWPRQGVLTVHETISRTTGGYAGLFDPALSKIDVAYDASDYVVLHESAHGWFNGALLTDRWANEAWASYYGFEVAGALKVKTTGEPLTPVLEAAKIPLNAWGAIGNEEPTTEDYAYAASLALARAIAARAGPDGLRLVWADAANRVGAYQPPVHVASSASGAAAPETVEGAPDWRGLLDLLEANTDATFDDLWRTGDWQLPQAVRDAMRAWRFEQATTLLDDAAAVLDQRATIATGAVASGLTVPASLQAAFESPDGFASAKLQAATETEAIHRYDAAVAARPATTDLLQAVGLWGTTPAADLDQARARFASGDLAGSASAASSAASAWIGAEDVGRGRLVSLGLLALAAVLAMILFGVWLRGRRRAGRARLATTATVASGIPDLDDAGDRDA